MSSVPDAVRSVTLCCLPFAGSSAQTYRGWKRFLPPWIRVAPLELPGRGTRFGERVVCSVEALARDLLGSVPTDGCWALFGHSMGALIAFELTRELCARGMVTPALLLASGLPAPHRLGQSFDPRGRSDAELLRAVMDYGGPSEALALDDVLRVAIMPALRADLIACADYRYEPRLPLSCPISVYVGTSDETMKPSEAQAWAQLTTGSVEIAHFPGAHFFIRSALPTVMERVQRDLRKLLPLE